MAFVGCLMACGAAVPVSVNNGVGVAEESVFNASHVGGAGRPKEDALTARRGDGGAVGSVGGGSGRNNDAVGERDLLASDRVSRRDSRAGGLPAASREPRDMAIVATLGSAARSWATAWSSNRLRLANCVLARSCERGEAGAGQVSAVAGASIGASG